MVKAPSVPPSDPSVRAREQREIRDWHTLVAKLASEAETLHSWTERPPADELDTKINGTLSNLASNLAGDARRLAGALPHERNEAGETGDPSDESSAAPKQPGTGLTIDKSV
jgi:hypothetical protein